MNSNENNSDSTRKTALNGGIKIFLILSLAINIVLITVSIIYLNECPIKRTLPIFLLSLGVMGGIISFLTVLPKLKKLLIVQLVLCLLQTTHLIIFIIEAYTVYEIYKPSFDDKSDQYCNKVFYNFTFSYISFTIGLLIAGFAGYIVFLICICCLAKNNVIIYDVEANRRG